MPVEGSKDLRLCTTCFEADTSPRDWHRVALTTSFVSRLITSLIMAFLTVAQAVGIVEIEEVVQSIWQ